MALFRLIALIAQGNASVKAADQPCMGCREGVHLRHEQAAEVKGRGKPKDLSKKAILLSGPPGIGKTSSASIISRWLQNCGALMKQTKKIVPYEGKNICGLFLANVFYL